MNEKQVVYADSVTRYQNKVAELLLEFERRPISPVSETCVRQ